MSDAVLRLVTRLEERLSRLRRRIYWAQFAASSARAVAVSAAVVLVALLAETIYWLPPAGRAAVLALGGAGLSTAWLYWAGAPVLRLAGVRTDMNLQDLARRIGERFPAVSDRLVNLLQLARGQGSIGDEELRERAVASLARDVEDVPFEEIATFEDARRGARWAGLGVGLLSLAFLTAPGSIGGAAHRLAHPATAFERPAPFQWTVRPGDTTVVRGESMRIRARAEGSRLPTRARLLTRYEGETRVETRALHADSTGLFSYRLPRVSTALSYRIEGEGVGSRWHRADLVSRPMVRRLQVRVRPPDYTGLPERTLPPNVGDVSALPGTRVTLSVHADRTPLRRAVLEFEERAPDTLAVSDRTAETTFAVQRPDTYRIRLTSTEGVANAQPIDYRIETLSDGPPTVEQLSPGRSADISGSAEADLRLRLADDYGFSRLRLFYRLAESRFGTPSEEFASIELPLRGSSGLDRTVSHLWRLTETTDIDPVRGDVVEYYVRVWDNNRVAGYRSARTPIHTLRVPSLAQEYRRLDQTQDSARTNLESINRQTEQLHREFESMRREIRRNRETGWENQQQVESLRQQQQQVQQRVEQLERQVRSMTDQMRRNDLVSEETLTKYRELQRVIEEIEAPELRKALEKMRRAMENVNFENVQQALEEFSFNEQEYRERIERTMELFRQMRTEQELDEMARRAENLAEMEEELARRTEELMRQMADSSAASPEQNETSGEGSRSQDESSDEKSPASDESGDEDVPSDSASRTARSDATPEEQSRVSEERADRAAGADSSRAARGARSDSASAASPSRESLSREQERARELMEELQDQMAEMEQTMAEMQNVPREQMQRLRKQLQQQGIPKQMRQNQQQIRQGALQEARQGQQSMQNQLQQLAQQLQSMQSSMQSRQTQINRAALRKTLEDVIVLSHDQEDLRVRLDELPDDSPALRSVSARQNAIAEGVRTVTDSLQSLARDIPQMSRQVQQVAGDALRAINATITRVGERDLGRAGAQQRTAMQELNRLGVLLAQLLEQLDDMNPSGSSGASLARMMKQIQQMAGQQQQLNQQLQQMLNDIQGSRLSRSQQERIRQMQRQQEAIRRQLREMREQGGEASDELLGQLDRVARQMEESIAEMRERNVDRSTVERQRQILSRLLQAQQSLRTQGRDDQRQGQTGEDVVRESPEALPDGEQQRDRLRRDLIRALENGYAPDYEKLIKQYFRRLEEDSGSSPGSSSSGSAPASSRPPPDE